MVAEYGLPSQRRLHKTDEFSSVFSFRCSVGGEFFQVLGKPNTLGYPRLGIVVGRKTARRACARNFMKRIVREFFRRYPAEFDSLDAVVRIRKSFGREMLPQARQELGRHVISLRKCHACSSS